MLECPNCKKKGISAWRKFMSGSDSPAECRECHTLSYVHSSQRYGFNSLFQLLVTVIVLVASIFVYKQFDFASGLAFFIVAWFVGKYANVVLQPMRVIAASEVKERQRYGNTFLMVVAVIALLVALISALV